MGVVYAAESSTLHKLVALKILPSDSMKDDKLLGRFKREASAVVRLVHPNLIQGYDWGELDHIHYFAMEYLEGETLKQKLRSQRRFSPEEALEIVLQIASALQYAGEMGLIHRDIKPENIMVTHQGVAKLCDLGLVKSSDETSQERLTVIGTVLGTPNYMSPEQASGEEVDIRTDIYSLGITFFQMLTGTTPFTGKTPAEILAKHIREEPPLVSDLMPEIDPRYVHVLDIMIAKKPEQRYQPQELVEELKLLREGEELSRKSAQVSNALEQLHGASARYKFAYVCSKEDGLFGRTLTKNKALTYTKVKEVLDYQEKMARTGLEMTFAEICVEKGYITSEQRKMVQNILDKHLAREEDFLFLRIAVDERYLTEEEFQDISKFQQKQTKGDIFPKGVDIALEKEYLNPESVKEIEHLVLVKRGAREDDAFSDLACRAQFLTNGQIRKCFKIQSNNIALHKYRPIKEIMVNKKFLEPAHEKVIFRALRRTALTFESTLKLVKELQLDEEGGSADKFGWETLAKEKETKDSLSALFKKACEYKEKGENILARDLLQEIIAVEFDHPQVRKVLEEIEDLLSSSVDLMYEGGRAFDQQNYEKALRLWEKALKIHPDNERMRTKAQEARKQLASIKENLRLGQKLFQEKKYKKALQFFQQVLDISEFQEVASKQYEECKHHLAQSNQLLAEAQKHIEEQNYEKAIECYTEALDISPENQEVPILLKKVKQKILELKSPVFEMTSLLEPIIEPEISETEGVLLAETPSENVEILSPYEEFDSLSSSNKNSISLTPEEPIVSENISVDILVSEAKEESDQTALTAFTPLEKKYSAFEETGVFKLEQIPPPPENVSPENVSPENVPVEALSPQTPSLPQRIDTSSVIDAFNSEGEEEVLNRFKINLENTSFSTPEESLPALDLAAPSSARDEEKITNNSLPQPLADTAMNNLSESNLDPQNKPLLETLPLKKSLVSFANRKGLSSLDASIMSRENLSSLEALQPGEKISKNTLEEEDISPLPSKNIFHTGSTMRILRSDLEAISLGAKNGENSEEEQNQLVEALHPDSPTLERALKTEDDIPHLTQRIFKTGTTKVLLTTEPLEPVSLVPSEIKSSSTAEYSDRVTEEDSLGGLSELSLENLEPSLEPLLEDLSESKMIEDSDLSAFSEDEEDNAVLEPPLKQEPSAFILSQNDILLTAQQEDSDLSVETVSSAIPESLVPQESDLEIEDSSLSELPIAEKEHSPSIALEEISSVVSESNPVEVAPVEVAPVEVAPAEVAPVEVAPVEVAPAVAPAEEVLVVKENESKRGLFFMLLLGAFVLFLFWFFQS